MREMKLQDLKSKTPAELVSFAEENGVENASTMRKQELLFAILKQLLLAHGAGILDPVLFRERDELGRRLRLEVLEFDFPHWGGPVG
jgi:transcription termination factor Rho